MLRPVLAVVSFTDPGIEQDLHEVVPRGVITSGVLEPGVLLADRNGVTLVTTSMPRTRCQKNLPSCTLRVGVLWRQSCTFLPSYREGI